MKKLLIPFMAVTGLLTVGCNQGDVIVEKPDFTVRNSGTLEISKVIINDTATLVYIDAFYRPKNWIKIDSATYLQAGEKKYTINGSEDIRLHEYHWMPESGELSFLLKFPPLPKNTKSFDLIESDCADCFKVYGIVLKPQKETDYLSVIPDAVRYADYSKEELPEPKLTAGETRVKIHLVGYRPGMFPKEVTGEFNSSLGLATEDLSAVIADDGTCEFVFPQYGPGRLIAFIDGIYPTVYLEGGTDNEVWVDLIAQGKRDGRFRRAGNENITMIYTSGKYSALNSGLNRWDWGKGKYLNGDTRRFYKVIGDMDKQQYFDYMRAQVSALTDSIDNDADLLPWQRTYLRANMNTTYVTQVALAPMVFMYAYMFNNDLRQPDLPKDYKTVIVSEEEVMDQLQQIDISSPYLLYSDDFMYYFGHLKQDCPYLFSENTSSFLAGLSAGLPLLRKTENRQELTPEEMQQLEAAADPFYRETYAMMNEEYRKAEEANKLKSGYIVCETPQVSDARLFDAIIAEHKGKVVMVDFWATWCSPCRSSIKANEPMKDEFNPQDIVFVYITGETSPFPVWDKMIPDIRGLHYRVSDKQWESFYKQFNIDGIPSYVLVSKDGSYKLRNDLRDHASVKEKLQKEIEL